MLNIILSTALRNFRVHKRAFPWSFFIGRMLTGIYTAFFGYFMYFFVFKKTLSGSFFQYAGTNDYMTYVITGSAMFVLAVASMMNVGRSLMMELWDGTLEVLILSPSSRLGYFIGVLLEQLLRSLLEFIPTLIMGYFLGASYDNIHIVGFLTALLLAIAGFFAMGVALAGMMIYARDTYITQNTLFISMSLVCGITFPFQYLPQWIQPLSHCFPLTYIMILFRKVVISGETIAQNMDSVGIIMALSVLYFMTGFIWFIKHEKLILEKAFI